MVVLPKPKNPQCISGNVVADGETRCATTLARSCGLLRIGRCLVGATPWASVLQVIVYHRWAPKVMLTIWRNGFEIIEPYFLTDPEDDGLHESEKQIGLV